MGNGCEGGKKEGGRMGEIQRTVREEKDEEELNIEG